MNMTMAFAGLLGSAADQGNAYLKRQQDLEDQKLKAEQEARREQAIYDRQVGLAKLQRQWGQEDYATQRQDKVADMDKQRGWQVEDQATNLKNQLAVTAAQGANQMAAAKLQGGMHMDAIREQARLNQENNPQLQSYKTLNDNGLLSVEDKKALAGVPIQKGGMTEASRERLEERLATEESMGVNDQNVKKLNVMRQALGMPTYVQKQVDTDKKWFGPDKPVMKWVEDDNGAYDKSGRWIRGAGQPPNAPVPSSGENTKTVPNPVSQTDDTGKQSNVSNPASKYLELAKSGQKSQKTEDKSTEGTGILSSKSAKVDLGQAMGTTVKIGKEVVDITTLSAKALYELNNSIRDKMMDASGKTLEDLTALRNKVIEVMSQKQSQEDKENTLRKSVIRE